MNAHQRKEAKRARRRRRLERETPRERRRRHEANAARVDEGARVLARMMGQDPDQPAFNVPDSAARLLGARTWLPWKRKGKAA